MNIWGVWQEISSLLSTKSVGIEAVFTLPYQNPFYFGSTLLRSAAICISLHRLSFYIVSAFVVQHNFGL